MSDKWLERADRDTPKNLNKAASLLWSTIVFDNTPEGGDYWYAVYRRLQEMAMQAREHLKGDAP